MFFFSTWNPDLKEISYVDPASVYRNVLVLYPIHANAFQRGNYAQTAITCAALVCTATFLSVNFCLIMGFHLSV